MNEKLSDEDKLKFSMLFDEIVKDIKSFEGSIPSIYCETHFTNMDPTTIAVTFDRFIGIMEYVEEINHYGYVALGRGSAEENEDSVIELVDTRVLEDDDQFMSGVQCFLKLLKKQKLEFKREIDAKISITNHGDVLKHIIDIWKFDEERKGVIIH